MASSSTLNFAPYAEPPDVSRPSLSSWSDSSSTSAPVASGSSYQSGAAVSSLSDGTSYSSAPTTHYPGFSETGYAPVGTGGGGLNSGYETTTVRHEYAGSLAYLFGPLGAAILLVFEVENDWVRFQAWQSILMNAFLVFLHLCFLLIFWRWFQYTLVLLDLGAATWMALRAFHDADHLDRYRLPLLGDLADHFVRSE
ncbi:hypothetical protein JCM11641_002992 [Rhodosporidiobolus odoratus]